MDYVAGQDLRSRCDAQGGVEQVPVEARLEIVAQVADAPWAWVPARSSNKLASGVGLQQEGFNSPARGTGFSRSGCAGK